MQRFRNADEDTYVMPKMFDKWKNYVHTKKLFRYWLGFAFKRGENGRADIAIAFDRWKNYDIKQKRMLSSMNRYNIEKRMIKNSWTLDTCAEEILDKENTLAHLNV